MGVRLVLTGRKHNTLPFGKGGKSKLHQPSVHGTLAKYVPTKSKICIGYGGHSGRKRPGPFRTRSRPASADTAPPGGRSETPPDIQKHPVFLACLLSAAFASGRIITHFRNDDTLAGGRFQSKSVKSAGARLFSAELVSG